MPHRMRQPVGSRRILLRSLSSSPFLTACEGQAPRWVLRRKPDAARRGTCGEGRARVRGLGLAKLANFANFTKFCKSLAGSFSAVSKRNFARKYASDSIFKLYKICILLHRCNLKILAKNRYEKAAILVNYQNVYKICKLFAEFLRKLLNFQTDFQLKF